MMIYLQIAVVNFLIGIMTKPTLKLNLNISQMLSTVRKSKFLYCYQNTSL